MATGMIIDGVFASQAIDSSGEVLDIEGCDISTLDKDGVLNYEHKEGDKKDPKGGNNGEEIVGKIIYAKKIFKQSDCETDRQREYFHKIGGIPFIYGMCRLYDGAGHSGAKALAAQIRDHVANNEQVLVRFSIEGSTLERHGNRLSQSVARRVAATLKPCNRTAVSGLIEDPKAPEGFEKKPTKQEKPVKDILAGLFDDKRDEEDAKKREHEHPMYSKLGGISEVECSPLIKDEEDIRKAMKLVVKAKMLKALAAGNYNVAPSGLTGGAALQREDLQSIKKRALAVLRNHGNKKFDKSEFKAVLKAKLPEADDSFIDHFADLAEDYHVKLKKMQGLRKDEEQQQTETPSVKPKKKPAAKPKAQASAPVKPEPKKAPAQKPAPVKAPKGNVIEAKTIEPSMAPTPLQLTIRGKPAPAPTSDKLYFDEKKGVLHVPAVAPRYNSGTGKWSQGHTGGQFPMYIPGRYNKAIHSNKNQAIEEANSFESLMNDKKVNEFHDYAMDNWQRVHQHLRDGTLPPEVAMHAALFAMLSPNTPVPVQEYMYGHLVDSIKHHGVDARDPAFSSLKDDWMGRDTGFLTPSVSPEHWDRIKSMITLKNPSYEMTIKPGAATAGISGKNLVPARDAEGNKIIKRPVGAYGAFQLANNKFKNMAEYHRVHDQFYDLIKRHGIDARSAVAELMHHKQEAEKDKYDLGPVVPGFKPKVARYTYGMLGGGNVVVPDTHFTRYLFGLEKGGKGQPKVDNDTIEQLKEVLWEPNNTHVMDGIDKHYFQHHPAVKHMLAHPKYSSVFAHPEQSIFPAFWKNWVAIVPHELARKYQSDGVNEYTDHRPYWDTIDDFFRKNENDDVEHTLPMRTAMLHHEWIKRHGEVPATLMYYRHIVPRLLAAAEARQKPEAIVRKMESLAIDLRKAQEEIKDSTQSREEEHEENGAVHFAGHHVIPGMARTIDGHFALLHEDKTHYVAVPQDKLSFWNPEDLTKLPKAQEGTHYLVHSRPSVLVADLER